MVRYLREFRNRPRFSSSAPWGPRPRRSEPECPTCVSQLFMYLEHPAVCRAQPITIGQDFFNLQCPTTWSHCEQEYVLLLGVLAGWILIRIYIS